MIFYESPHRTAATLADFVQTFGADRRGTVSRELTKLYEEVRRGTLAELAEWAEAERIRGEIVIIVEGAQAPETPKLRTSCSWFSTAWPPASVSRPPAPPLPPRPAPPNASCTRQPWLPVRNNEPSRIVITLVSHPHRVDLGLPCADYLAALQTHRRNPHVPEPYR